MEQDCLRNSDTLVREALSPAGDGRDRMVARVFDDLSDELCRVADLAEFVRLSHPDPRFRQSAEQACISVSNQGKHLVTTSDEEWEIADKMSGK